METTELKETDIRKALSKVGISICSACKREELFCKLCKDNPVLTSNFECSADYVKVCKALLAKEKK